MRKNKTMPALLLAAALIVGGIAVSFADETAPVVHTTTITMTTDENITSTNFAAYRLLDVTVSKDSDGNDVYKYSVNSKYRVALQGLTGQTTDNNIITYISKLDATGIRKFADDFYKLGLVPDATTTASKFENVPQGYYLVAETSTSDEQDTISLVMVDTAAKETVEI